MTKTSSQNPPTLRSGGGGGETQGHPRQYSQYPSRIMSWGLTCIRAIAAAAKVANPLRRPPGAILSPVRPRSLAGALNAEAEGDDGGGPEGVGAPAPHRLAWGGVDFLE